MDRNVEIFITSVYRKIFFPFKKLTFCIKKKIVVDTNGYFDRSTELHGRNYIGRNTFLSEVDLGYGSYVADESYLFKTKIGKYCSIAPRVTTAIGHHPINECISTSPSFFSNSPVNGLCYHINSEYCEFRYRNKSQKFCIEIGNDVWIGAGVVLLEGIRIGDGAVIGAGSVVTKDIEPYGVYAGCPAKKIKSRFEKDEIEQLLHLQWWNKEEEWIKEHAAEFNYVNIFIERNRNI
jgi:acetyltransferase-like isoleucine patch superfamily enzyme